MLQRICRLSGQVVGKCLQSSEALVEIPEKLELIMTVAFVMTSDDI
jgi:hypothetical protein